MLTLKLVRISKWIATGAILVWTHTTMAGSVVDLFAARIDVESQSSRAQSEAARQAMRQVLVKVSGSDDILKDDTIRQQIRSAANYLRGYKFEVEQGKTRYVAEFSEQAILRLVRTNGFPVWDSRRPDTLVWLAHELPGSLERELLSEASVTDIKAVLETNAQARGVPLDYPLLDLEDVQSLGVFDVWGGFTETVREASQRYGTDLVVAARIYLRAPGQEPPEASGDAAMPDLEDDGYQRIDFAQQAREIERGRIEMLREPTWFLDWQILQGDQVVRGQFSDKSRDTLLSRLVNHIADTLAQEYAVVGQLGAENRLELTINNVKSLDDYVNVHTFLRSVSSVANVVLVSQQASQARFSLELLGSREDFLNTLRLDDKMTPRLDEFGREVAELEFEWQD